MKRKSIGGRVVLSVLIASVLASSPAFADKPAGKGRDKDRGEEQRDERGDGDRRDERGGDRRDGARESLRHGEYFDERRHTVVREYYGEQFRAGRCPPGLAKKHNGCMPPGQAKKWAVGQPLPRDVIFHEVPRDLVIQIGPAPRGYRYVQVASDILLLAIGTSMVVDAIQNLGAR